jgi:putative ABC transport system permease protein
VTAPRAYRALLRLLPRRLRDTHGHEMEELFVYELARARRDGGLAVIRVWLSAFFDFVTRAAYEHWRHRGRRPMLAANKEHRMSSLLADLRFAIRTFSRQPGATALVVFTLSLAVAANTAVFALVDAVFFRALPYPNASRLVDVNEIAPSWGLDFVSVNYPDFDTWRKNTRAFEGIALYDDGAFNVADGNEAVRLDGQFVTYDLAKVLGIRPVLGRTFTKEEDVPNGPNVVMIGHGLWQTRFAGARDVIGKTLRISSIPYTIIGVLPPNVTLDGQTQLWIPLRGDPKQQYQSYSYEGVGRLKPGVTLEQARQDLAMAHEPIWRARDTAHVVSPRIMPLRDRFVADYKTIGAALGAGVILVLLIACANVAGAMLTRSIFRRREMGIRIALGASSSRLTRQLLTESFTLAAIAGVIGTMLGRVGVLLLTMGVNNPPPWLHLQLDARAIAFSVLIVVATTIVFGLVPVLQLRRPSVSSALTSASPRTSGSAPERRMLDALVVVEIALAAVLLASGGLLIRAYMNLRDVDPGFRPEGVATFRISLPDAKYKNGLEQRRFYETLIARIRALPGVTDAGAVTCAPFSCHQGNFFRAEGAAAKKANEKDPVVLTRTATPGYFRTMGIQLVRGRFFAENEGTPDGPRPAVINDILEKQLWPDGSSSIGKRFIYSGDTVTRDWMTVVGVVKDVRHYGLARPMIGGIYRTSTSIDSTNGFQRLSVVAHTNGDPSALFPALRSLVRELDPELPLFDVKTMSTAVNQSVATRRAIALSLATFAGIALALAIGGIYAVLSHVVGRRRHEIGIRMALGAQSSQVLGLVVRQGLRLVAIGLAIGVPAGLLSSRVLSSLLVGVTGTDPMTYVGVAVVLTATGVLAALIPARRAARVNPKLALTEG